LFLQLQQERQREGTPPVIPSKTTAATAVADASSMDVAPTILVPAFIISELKTAFQMAFLIYIPFLVLDLVVAAILMSMGMMFLPPALISLPFKLVLFVLVDGWSLLVGSLVRSFA
jgi:flagellar biosynthetic protein FliP